MPIVMRLGTVPGGAEAEARAVGLARALTSLLGVDVELHRAADYRVLLAAIEQGTVHFAWMPPIPASRGLASGALNPVAVIVRNGVTSYMTGLVTMRSSRFHGLADLRDARAAWVDRESAAGYVVIRAALRNAQVSLVTAFAQETFERSHGAVALALKEGRADVGATYFTFASGSQQVSRSGYLDAGLSHDDVRMLAHAGPIPSDVFAVHKGVPQSMITAIQAALVDARPARFFEAARALTQGDAFTRPGSEHFAMLREVLVAIEGASQSTMPRPLR